MRQLVSQHHLLQTRLRPQPVGKRWVVDLVAVVDPHRLTALGLAGCGDEGQLAQKGNIVAAERPWPKGAQDDNGAFNYGLYLEIDDGKRWFEGGPRGWGFDGLRGGGGRAGCLGAFVFFVFGHGYEV